MKINEKGLKELVKEIISELNLSESDIIVKEKSEWKEMKSDFKNKIKDLIKNIEDDKYSDANGDIDQTIKILKTWKKRLSKNLDDSTSV
jgi:Txe/YoeB family toxin of Txe-Axe toxin-antitoxin module